MSSKAKINWEGSFFIQHSLAMVNREVCKRLIKNNTFDIGTIPYEHDPEFIVSEDLSSIRDMHVTNDEWANITIRHQWPPNFTKPQSSKWILFQPWEYGAIPKNWYIPMKYWIDEIWVPSTYNKESYVRSGIPENKIKVIPLGVDENIFHYDVKPWELKTKKTFHFLFVGGTIFRKGIDILLQAYVNEFSADDDVCLVIKDFGTQSFYKGATIGEWITEFQKNTENPEILYIDTVFSSDELASLYKACDCLVHPYRGEGFGLPIIESMACGTPAIVPSLGPALDFCNEDTAFFISCQEERGSVKKIGEMETVDYPWWLKVDENELRKIMRFVYKNKNLVEKKGKQASKEILSSFTWNQTVKIISEALEQTLKQVSAVDTDEKTKTTVEVVQKNTEKDIDILDSISSSNPQSISVKYQTAFNYIIQKDYTKALMYLYQIKDRMQDESKEYQSEIWNCIGVCHTYRKECKKAHEAFQLAIKFDPTNTELAIECYNILIKNAERNKSLVEVSVYSLSLGNLYFEMGNDIEAANMYKKVLKLDPQCSEVKEKLMVLNNRNSFIKKKYINKSQGIEINDVSDVYHHIAHYFEGDEDILRERRKQWIHYFQAGERVLDIGCGNGFFMEMLEKSGIHTEGIEIDKQKVIQGRAKGLNIQEKRAEEFLRDKKGVFDGIFLGHIIEHIPVKEALDLLIQCAKALKPSGKIIILTPNIGNPRVNETFWLDITHIRPYPRLLVISILQLLGLDVKECKLLEDEQEYSIVAQKNCYEILWDSPVLNFTGYAEEQKDFLTSLKPFPLKIQLVGNEIQPKPEIQSIEALQYLMALKVNQLQQPLFHYQAGPAYQFSFPRSPISIGRTMFETDSVPEGWVGRMNNLSEIWVPSSFNKQTFCTAGLDEKKIFIMPASIDGGKYNPEQVKPYKLKHNDSFHFLTVLDWHIRKGWDILLQAYMEEFNADENVSLVIKLYKMLNPNSNPLEDIRQITKKIGKSKLPNIQLIDSMLSNDEMIGLYAAADSFVMPSRGEGWGRPYMEAMAMGLPTIGTRWSSQTDFMNDANSYLIEIEKLIEVDNSMPFFYQGHHWAQPSVEHLRKLMRKVFENQDEAKKIGNKAREYVLSQYSQERIAKRIYGRLQELVQIYYG